MSATRHALAKQEEINRRLVEAADRVMRER